MNSLLEALCICFSTCSFHERFEVSVTPKLCRLWVLLIWILLKSIGGMSGGDFFRVKCMNCVLDGLKVTFH